MTLDPAVYAAMWGAHQQPRAAIPTTVAQTNASIEPVEKAFDGEFPMPPVPIFDVERIGIGRTDYPRRAIRSLYVEQPNDEYIGSKDRIALLEDRAQPNAFILEAKPVRSQIEIAEERRDADPAG